MSYSSYSFHSLRPSAVIYGDSPYGDDDFQQLLKEEQKKTPQYPLTYRRDFQGYLYLSNPVKVGQYFFRRGTPAHLKALKTEEKRLTAASIAAYDERKRLRDAERVTSQSSNELRRNPYLKFLIS